MLAASRRQVLGGAAALALAPSAAGAAAPRAGGPWVDAHCHLQGWDWFKSSPFAGPPPPVRHRASPAPKHDNSHTFTEVASAVKGVTAYGLDIESQTRRLLEEMDGAGIDTAILYAMDYDCTGEKLRVQHYDQVRLLAEARDRHPGRFVLFAAVDPRRGAEAPRLLRRLHADFKIAGMGEFAPHFFGFAPNDRERCYPIYEVCAELGLHIAPNCSIVANSVSRFCDPLYFEDVAHDFPSVNLCLTSAGAPHWAESALALCQAKPNVFMDVGDWQAKTSSDPIDTVLRFVRRALDTEARTKIMFGSDYPVFTKTVSERAWVDVFTTEAARRSIAFSDDDIRRLFSENAQDYLNMDLKTPVRS